MTSYDDLGITLADAKEAPNGHADDDQHLAGGSGHLPAAPAGGTTDSVEHTYSSPQEHFDALLKEYHFTQRVLAVVVEQLLFALMKNDRSKHDLEEVALEEELLVDCPDLAAYREAGKVILRVTR